MARYFAEIQDNIVQRVIVCESKEWCETQLGGEWIETFLDDSEKKHASKNYIYYSNKKTFGPPKPYPSWKLEKNLTWKAPKTRPETSPETPIEERIYHIWNEDNLDWEIK